tara:strand:+ start:1069 stop:1620 length:552 start_codon:yes stop_codon:yes gene_type:complete
MSRMHHHDKHAATKDGHRADDPHGVTGWKPEETDVPPEIFPEGHEVFDENVDYGQRVSAFGKVERDASTEHGYPLEGDEAVDVMEGEEDQVFAKKAMYGQDLPPPPPRQTALEAAIVEQARPPLTAHEQTWADIQHKSNVADVQQWHKNLASDKKVSDRLGIPAPPRPAPKWRDTPAPPEPPR